MSFVTEAIFILLLNIYIIIDIQQNYMHYLHNNISNISVRIYIWRQIVIALMRLKKKILSIL